MIVFMNFWQSTGFKNKSAMMNEKLMQLFKHWLHFLLIRANVSERVYIPKEVLNANSVVNAATSKEEKSKLDSHFVACVEGASWKVEFYTG